MATSKPDLTRVWAEGAPGANIIDPDTTTPGKVNAGWLAEIPPFEHFNFLQKWFTQGLAHANEQGIMVWDAATTYPVDGLSKGSDGTVYKAILEQSGNDPVLDGGINWGTFGSDPSSSIVFDNIADMKLGTASSGQSISFLVGQLLKTQGGLAKGDQGSGQYYVSNSGSATAFDFDLGGGLTAILIHNGKVNAKQAEIHTDGTNAAANNVILEAIKDYVISITTSVGRPVILWPSGNIAYSVSPNWGHSDVTSFGCGSNLTRFTYSGSGIAWNIDPSAFDVSFRYGISHNRFLIDCGASATHGIREENIAHSKYEDVVIINGAAAAIHWEQALTVLNTYTNCGSPINRVLITSNPAECLRLSASPSKLQSSTANTFINWIAEGATGAAIRLFDADVNTFVGGTAESNTGRGVLINTTCRNNTFNNLDMENNTVEDFNDAGQGTVWNNCLATSTVGSTVGSLSVLSKIKGGYFETLLVDTGAIGAVLEDFNINVNGSGGLTDLGIDTVKRNIYDKTAASILVNLKDARTNVTVGASPFLYTNSSTQLQQILVRSGTVSQVLWGRGGDTAIVGGGGEGANVNDQFILSPGDTLTVSYSVAPTMNLIPMGVINL